MNGMSEGMILCGLGFSFLALGVSATALIRVIAMEKSTHRVTFYDPATQEFAPLNDEQKKELTKAPFDNV